MTINEICSACINALRAEGYNESTIFNYEGVIRRFKQICEERNITLYSNELGKAYADDVISRKTSKFSKNRCHTQGRFYRLIDSYFSTGAFDFSLMKKGRIVPDNVNHQRIYMEYTSNLKLLIEDFLEFKHALGMKYDTGRFYPEQLDKYNKCHSNSAVLTRDLAENWANQQAEKSITSDRSRISPIREFGRYLYSIGYEEAYIPDDRYKIQKYHADVYLLSEEEIKLFFEECDRFVLRHKANGRPYVLPALYRFLYCCGVRCSEARNLKCSGIHPDEGYADIIQSKAHRDRRLYLSDELVDYLKKYNEAISKCFPDREYFFPGGAGGICSTTAVSANFRNIWLSAGLKRDCKVRPRAYDFRHHFVCTNIMKWSDEGKDIHAMLPKYAELTASTEELIPEVENYEV